MKRSQPVIILDVGQFRYALAVDALDDPEEIVVKPLGKRARVSTCLAGATILGDGGIALILDPAGLMSHIKLTAPEEAESGEHDADASSAESHSVLLFEQNPGEQFGVAMSTIARIERATAAELCAVGAQEVLLRGDKMLPLLRLDRHVNVGPLPQCKVYYVLVFQLGDKEFGILSSRLNEVRDVSSNQDFSAIVEPKILGSTVVDGTPTRMLDVFALGRTCLPKEAESSREHRPIRILLADDSNFFRRQIACYLDLIGYHVTEASDGEAAWTILREQPFDLVVTDVEMPNLNGIDLCRRIRADERTSELPLIAVTTHDDAKSRQACSDAGFDEFQSKNHRDQLTRAVERQARRIAAKKRTMTASEKEAVCR